MGESTHRATKRSTGRTRAAPSGGSQPTIAGPRRRRGVLTDAGHLAADTHGGPVAARRSSSSRSLGWMAAQQIRSPAQVAADTAAPSPRRSPSRSPGARCRPRSSSAAPSATARRSPSSWPPRGSSRARPATSSRRPPRASRPGSAAATWRWPSTGGRCSSCPGAIPMHRDLGPGDRGADVRQLERALSRMGASPGRVDGVYDARDRGRGLVVLPAPRLGSVRPHRRPARRAAHRRGRRRDGPRRAAAGRQQRRSRRARAARPSEVTQARIDANNARDAIGTARLRVSTAQAKLDAGAGRGGQRDVRRGRRVGQRRRDQALADADVAGKRRRGRDGDRGGAAWPRPRRFELPPGGHARRPPGGRRRRHAGRGGGRPGAGRAQRGGRRGQRGPREPAGADVQKARNDGAKLVRDVRVARPSCAARGRRLRARPPPGAAGAPQGRRVITQPPDTGSLRGDHRVGRARGAPHGGRGRAARRARPASRSRPTRSCSSRTCPLRVDAVTAKRGSTVSGRVMNVTNSRLAIDSSLSVSDQKLVRAGDRVTIEEQDLGITARGRVTPGRHARPAPTASIPTASTCRSCPTANLPSLVGASVKLTISVKSTRGSVLAVPVERAVDRRRRPLARPGPARRQRTELVPVVPGPRRRGPGRGPPGARRAAVARRPRRRRLAEGRRAPSPGAAPAAGRERRARPGRAARRGRAAAGRRAARRQPRVRQRPAGPCAARRRPDHRATARRWPSSAPSGSGKSTLLNILGCLDRQTTGTYLLDGIDVGHARRRPARDAARRGDRLRLPDLQPARPPDGARQRDARRGSTAARRARAARSARMAALERVGMEHRATLPAARGCRAASSSASPSRAR